MDPFKCQGGIVIDEIKLSEHLSVDTAGRVSGFVDLGAYTPKEEKQLPCDHGLVVMFVPLTGSWSQILGTFATRTNIKGELLAKIVLEATILAEKAGLFVNYVTCDAATWNRKMWRIMGVKANSKEVIAKRVHPSDDKRSLYFLSDFPHLVKNIRNRLLQTSFHTPDGKVSMGPLREALKIDENNLTLKAMPRLTKTHIEPNNFEKMRVSLAFQIFGSDSLRGLQLYKSQLEKCGNIEPTQKFFSCCWNSTSSSKRILEMILLRGVSSCGDIVLKHADEIEVTVFSNVATGNPILATFEFVAARCKESLSVVLSEFQEIEFVKLASGSYIVVLKRLKLWYCRNKVLMLYPEVVLLLCEALSIDYMQAQGGGNSRSATRWKYS
ncbi:hypothetical protein HPB49_016702 [Dermacentor silvarum]|uniref:Uncharacterized protein n=1 Tax=Dermacentor silvarum TaxID=543639 RepID=A0ACB8D6H8_DERSI|nr:hypothetical protein HPB49_016702 [Dermacentor silvarum]